MSEAAAAPAVGTIPVELPGLERCSSLQQCSWSHVSDDYSEEDAWRLSNWSIKIQAEGTYGARYSQNEVTAETTSL